MSINTIALVGKSCVDSTNNAKYKYTFNTSKYFKRTDQIALNLCNIFYSWRNIISSSYNNNSFQYQWFGKDLGTMDTFTVNIPDSYMSVSDINEYLITYMDKKFHYTIATVNGVSTKTYYLVIRENSTYYSVEFDFTVMPTNATPPAGAIWKAPTTASTPSIIINSTNNFGSLLGYSAGVYPTTIQSSNTYTLSNLTPKMSPVSSILMSCNLIKNDFSYPNNILHTFSAYGNDYGSMIKVIPTEKTYIDIVEGSYSAIEISFYDQDNNYLKILDNDLLIMLDLKIN